MTLTMTSNQDGYSNEKGTDNMEKVIKWLNFQQDQGTAEPLSYVNCPTKALPVNDNLK